MHNIKKIFDKFKIVAESSSDIRLILLISSLLGVLAVVNGVFLKNDSFPDKSYAFLSKEANKIIDICAKESYGPSCYDREIPKLMDYISMEDAFRVTSIVQEKDKTYSYCHVTGHELSAREVQKDPDKWKDVVSRCPTGMCSNGCLHGGFQERFRAETFSDEEIEKLKPDLETLCEKRDSWNPTGLEQASCYHAIGHLSMYLTNADINRSINLCEEVAIKLNGRDYSQLCFDGAFMQIFQPLEPEDFALIAGKEVEKEKLYSFCHKFEGKKRDSCWTEGWPLYRSELAEPKGLVDHCSKADDANRCYNAIIYVMTAQFGLDSDKVFKYCSGLPDTRSGRCFANAASRMIEVDYRNAQKAIGLCEAGSDFDKNSECLNELLMYSTYNYHVNSEPFLKLCNGLPDPWKLRCLDQSTTSNRR